MQSNNLLSDKEVEAVLEYNGSKSFLPLMWALEEVRHAITVTYSHLYSATDIFYVNHFRGHAYRLRGAFETIAELFGQEVPFAYFHMVKLMLLSTLPFFSFAVHNLLQDNPFISMTVFVSVALIHLSLEAMSVALADPFGDDDTDLDTDEMLRDTYQNVISLLRDENAQHLRGDLMLPELANPACEASDAVMFDIERRISRDVAEHRKTGLPYEAEDEADSTVLSSRSSRQSRPSCFERESLYSSEEQASSSPGARWR